MPALPVGDRAAALGNAVGEAVSDLVETVGTVGRDALDRAGIAAGRVPGAGTGLRGLVHWLATVVSAAGDMVATLLKVVVELVVAAVVAVLRLVAGAAHPLGRRAAGRRTFVQGAGEVASSLVGPVVVTAGKGLALVQAVLWGQRGERPLTADEHSRLEQIFRGAVALHNVRVVDGFSGLFGINVRPFTLGNTIYMKGYLRRRGPERYAATLVHEAVHVWQNQNVGTRYAVQALWAQLTIDDRYNWEKELTRGRTRWSELNREAQAQLIMHIWQHGRGPNGQGPAGDGQGTGAYFADDPIAPGARFRFGGTDHTALARAATAAVRGARPVRYSRRLRRH